MPIAAVTGQPRRLDRKHGADAAFADRSQQALEAWPLDAASRAAEIVVNGLDRTPAKLPRSISEPILPPAALRVVQELIGRRLADVDEGASAQMLSRDLGHRRSPRLPAPLQSRAAEFRPASPVESSAQVVARRAARRSRTDPAVGL